MSEQTTIELQAPLPGNALEARLTWRKDRGALRGDQDVPRSEATHAVLWLRGLDGKGREQRLELDDADRWLAEAAAMRERTARLDAEAAQKRAQAGDRRRELAVSVRPRCPYCDEPRRYAGRRNLMSAGAPEHIARDEGFQRARPEVAAYEEYACSSCGSIELFRAGALEHPLPGTER